MKKLSAFITVFASIYYPLCMGNPKPDSPTDSDDSKYEFGINPSYLGVETSNYEKEVTTVNKSRVETHTRTVKTGSSSVLPRITFLFDDSGSMATLDSGKTRLNHLKSAIMATAGTKYKDKAVYNVMSLWGDGSGDIGKYSLSGWVDGASASGVISRLTPGGVTPTTATYISAVDTAYSAIKYACQRNYVIVLSDGDANFDDGLGQHTEPTTGHYSSIYNRRTNASETSFRAKRSHLSHLYELNNTFNAHLNGWLPDSYLYYTSTYTDGLNAKGYWSGDRWVAGDGAMRGHDFWHYGVNNKNSVCHPTILSKNNPEGTGRGYCAAIEKEPGPDTIFMYKGAINTARSEDPRPAGSVLNGIEYFSDKVFKNILKSGTDIEGNPYVSEANGVFVPQHIQTLSISLGSDLSDNGRAYLRRAVRIDSDLKDALESAKYGAGYVDVTSGSELTTVFDNLLQAITSVSTVSSSVGTETSQLSSVDYAEPVSTTSSAVKTSLASPVYIPVNVISKHENEKYFTILTVDTNKWESQIKPYRLVYQKNKVDDWHCEKSGLKYLCYAPLEYTSEIYRKLPIKTSSTRVNLKSVFGFDEYDDYPIYQKYLNNDANATILNAENKNLEKSKIPYYNDPVKIGDVLSNPVYIVNNLDLLGGMDADLSMSDNSIVLGSNDGFLYEILLNKEYVLNSKYLPTAINYKDITLAQNITKRADRSVSDKIFGINGNHSYFTTPVFTKNNVKVTYPSNSFVSLTGEGGRGGIIWTSRTGSPEFTFEFTNTGGIKPGYTLSKSAIYNYTDGWEISDDDFSPLKPNGTVQTIAFVPNGYVSEKSDYESLPTLYMFSAAKTKVKLGGDVSSDNIGTLIHKVQMPTSSSDNNALGNITLLDYNHDGIVDIGYAGDYNGSLYRIDFRGKTPKATKIFEGLPANPIVASPAVYRVSADGQSPKFVISVGTGSNIYKSDREIKYPSQYLIGVYDDLIQSSPITFNDLHENIVNTSGNTRQISGHYNIDDYKGWYIKLDEGNEFLSAERVTSEPGQLLDTVYFTTNLYNINKTEVAEGNESEHESCTVEITPEVLISSSSSNKSGSQESCTGSGVSVQVYEFKKIYKCVESKEHTSELTLKDETRGQSWLISLDIKTGLSAKHSNSFIGRGHKSEMSEDNPEQSNDLIGEKYDEILSSPIVQSMSDLNKIPDVLSENGVIGNGRLSFMIDIDDPNVTHMKSNKCVNTQDFILDMSGSESGFIAKGLLAKKCSNGAFIRTSLREIKSGL